MYILYLPDTYTCKVSLYLSTVTVTVTCMFCRLIINDLTCSIDSDENRIYFQSVPYTGNQPAVASSVPSLPNENKLGKPGIDFTKT